MTLDSPIEIDFDKIKGEGAYKKFINTLILFKENDIRINLSVPISGRETEEFIEEVVCFCKKYGVFSVRFSPIIPVSSNAVYVKLIKAILEYTIKDGKPTLVGACTGLVVGLVAITPGAGFVPIWASFIIGALVSPICYTMMNIIKQKLKIDDSLDAFGCHGIGGIWGGIATGLFGQSSINSVAQWDGLVFGETKLFVAQIISILVTIAVAVVGSLICIGIIRIFTKLRVDEKDEIVGLDASQHGENAYPSFNGFD